jgi:hypothetical protein
VRGGPDHLDAALERPPVRVGAGEGGQERMVDDDHRRADAGEEVLAQDLHVAGQDHQVEAAG